MPIHNKYFIHWVLDNITHLFLHSYRANRLMIFLWLLCVGLLAAVGNLTLSVQDSMLLATWTAPFTLTIEVGEDDISYCIDIINITSSSSLFSQCGINATQISLSLSLDDVCHVYRITVTPVNVVGRGERNSLIYSQIESSM